MRRRPPGPGRSAVAARSVQGGGVLDLWLKDIAPSTELSKWYAHDPAKFARGGTVTSLTATKDVTHSEATVLADVLGRRQRQ